jgi:hypothetical protein
MRSFATTRSGTAALPADRVLLHWQLDNGQPQVLHRLPPSVEYTNRELDIALRFWTTIALLAAAACESPTKPDPRIPPPIGTPTSMMLQPCEYGAEVAVCPVQARWGDLYASFRTVTSQAQWSSSAPHIVRVVGPGTLQAVGPGDAEITALYNSRGLTATFRVFAEGPPWLVSRGPGLEYHIRVVDQQGAALEGVLVQITAGANAGRSAISDRSGSAIFRDEIVCGPITVRGSKDGYHDWIGSAVRCGRAGNGSWGSETIGPVQMIPIQSR